MTLLFQVGILFSQLLKAYTFCGLLYISYIIILEFVLGKEYEFEYESQVLTGFPTFSKQYTGIKITADVKLKFEKSVNSEMQVLFNLLLSFLSRRRY